MTDLDQPSDNKPVSGFTNNDIAMLRAMEIVGQNHTPERFEGVANQSCAFKLSESSLKPRERCESLVQRRTAKNVGGTEYEITEGGKAILREYAKIPSYEKHFQESDDPSTIPKKDKPIIVGLLLAILVGGSPWWYDLVFQARWELVDPSDMLKFDVDCNYRLKGIDNKHPYYKDEYILADDVKAQRLVGSWVDELKDVNETFVVTFDEKNIARWGRYDDGHKNAMDIQLFKLCS